MADCESYGTPTRGAAKESGAVSGVIYLHVAEADVILLMDIYGKDEQEDLTTDQKKVLKRLADGYKSAAIQTARAFKKGTI